MKILRNSIKIVFVIISEITSKWVDICTEDSFEKDYIIPQKFRRKKFRRKNFGTNNFGGLLGISAEKVSAGKKSASIFAEYFSGRNFWFGLYPNSFRNGIFRDLIFDWINRKIDYGIVGGLLGISEVSRFSI